MAAGCITGQVDYRQALLARCEAAGLRERQTQIILGVCDGESDAELAERLEISVQGVQDGFKAAVRNLIGERRELSREDLRTILRCIQGKSDRHDDPTLGYRGDWWTPARSQGMQPFGMVPSDHGRPGPAGQLLDVVCELTGTAKPPLRLLQSEAYHGMRIHREGRDYVGVEVERA